MKFVLKTFHSKPFMVETGAKNKPASVLYRKFDFIEIKQWETDFGIRKVRFERQ